jgi:hypothetical protein
MGNRRIGARRLKSLERRGVTGLDTSYQAGPGISDAVVSHRLFNDGVFRITEIVVDLGYTGAAIVSSDGADEAFGVAASGGCQLMQWEDDHHGQFLFSEVYVLEAFTSVTACSLISGTDVEAVSDAIAGAADIHAGFATNALGSATSHTGASLCADGEYVYLTGDNNTNTTMSAGIIVIRMVGAVATDISLS